MISFEQTQTLVCDLSKGVEFSHISGQQTLSSSHELVNNDTKQDDGFVQTAPLSVNLPKTNPLHRNSPLIRMHYTNKNSKIIRKNSKRISIFFRCSSSLVDTHFHFINVQISVKINSFGYFRFYDSNRATTKYLTTTFRDIYNHNLY